MFKRRIARRRTHPAFIGPYRALIFLMLQSLVEYAIGTFVFHEYALALGFLGVLAGLMFGGWLLLWAEAKLAKQARRE